jgi:hypothetical protein
MNYDLFEKTSPIPSESSDAKMRDRQGARSNSTVPFVLSLVSGDGVALPLGEFDGRTFDSVARKAYQQFRGSLERLHPLAWSIADRHGESAFLERLGKPRAFK